MGAYSSRNPEFEEASRLFTGSEKERIQDVYRALSGGNKSFSFTQFQAHLRGLLLTPIDVRLYDYMQNGVGFEAFVIALAHILKGTLEERVALLFRLGTDPERSTLEYAQLKSLLGNLLKSFLRVLGTNESYQLWQLSSDKTDMERLSSALLLDLKEDAVLAESDMEKWLSQSPLVLKMMDSIWHQCFPVCVDKEKYAAGSVAMFPVCVNVDWSKVRSVLTPEAVLYLNSHLPGELHAEWRLLFSSTVHGESFATLLKYMINKGPSLLILKDTDGNQFGGFASESWALRPQFVGDMSCFLFSLSPKMQIYPATDKNTNFMYLNRSQETMPNGLGMGGQLDYFGLWLDSEYGYGSCKAEPRCTTYNSPQLSNSAKFTYTHLEVWGLGPDPSRKKQDEDDEDGAHTSILDKDPESKAMLQLLNRGPVSEGLRESDPMADSPDADEAPPTSSFSS